MDRSLEQGKADDDIRKISYMAESIGTSQQHKHVQIMPLPNSGPQPPLRALFNEIQERKAGNNYRFDSMRYVEIHRSQFKL